MSDNILRNVRTNIRWTVFTMNRHDVFYIVNVSVQNNVRNNIEDNIMSYVFNCVSNKLIYDKELGKVYDRVNI